LYFGLAISFLLHAGLLAWAFFSMQSTQKLQLPETPVIEASIITPSDFLRLKQGDPNTKELESKAKEEPQPEISKKEAPKPKPITAPPPPSEEPPPPPPQETAKLEPPPPPEPPKSEPPPPAKAPEPPPPEPAPGPTLEEQKALEQKLLEQKMEQEKREKEEAERKQQEEAKKKAEEQRKAEEEKRKKEEKKRKEEEKKKAEEKRKKIERQKKLAEQKRKEKEKKKFDADRIAALIDKSPDKRGAPLSATTPPTKPTDYTGRTMGERKGNDTVLSAREQDLLLSMIQRQLQPCSKLPGGGGGPDTPVVTVKFQLRADGSLEGEPLLVSPQNTPLYNIAADASIRAIKQCSPFSLPADKYGAWSSVTWTFDWPVILGIVQR
jgi:colicin import membrane protein